MTHAPAFRALKQRHQGSKKCVGPSTADRLSNRVTETFFIPAPMTLPPMAPG
jgi:hypothetical protein